MADTQATARRHALESKLIDATISASENILSCRILSWLISVLGLRENLIGAAAASLALAAAVFGVSWSINILGPQPDSLAFNWVLIIPALLGGLALLVVKALHDSVLPPNRDKIAALPVDSAGFSAFCDWFSSSFRTAPQVLFSLAIVVCADASLMTLSSNYEFLTTNLGFYLAVSFGMFAMGNGGYCALVIPTLASTGSQHRLHLFPYNPASTTALRIGGSGLGKLALANGLVATLVIALIAAFRPWTNFVAFRIALGWLILGWGVAGYSFLFPHYHISRIIAREKQLVMEELESVANPSHSGLKRLSKEKLEQLQISIALREQILKSRDSLIDFQAVRDFVGSLLLPSLTFILGFVDVRTVLKALL